MALYRVHVAHPPFAPSQNQLSRTQTTPFTLRVIQSSIPSSASTICSSESHVGIALMELGYLTCCGMIARFSKLAIAFAVELGGLEIPKK